jgi:hypothetical protein
VYPPSPTTSGVGLSDMVVDASDIWVVQFFGNGIQRCAKTGCASLTTVVSNIDDPYDLVVDDSHLFWVSGQVWGTNPKPPKLMRANKDGTAVQVLSQGLDYTNLTVLGTTLYFVDGTVSTGGVRSCPISDCSNPTPLMPDAFPINFDGLLVDPSGAYASQNGSMYFAPLGSGIDKKIGPGAKTVGTNLVAVGSTLFWGERGTGEVNSLPKSGGTTRTRASGFGRPQMLAADQSAAYFSTDDGKIVKVVN